MVVRTVFSLVSICKALLKNLLFCLSIHSQEIKIVKKNFRCLEKNPEHRPYMEELLEHPFITQVSDDVSLYKRVETKNVNHTRKTHAFDAVIICNIVFC